LGVPASATSDEIKAAYRRLALKYHPDRNPGDRSAEARFKEISEAYATLRDPEARSRFDRFGRAQPGGARPDFSHVDWQTVFQEADIHVNWQAGAPRTGNAVFDALFGVVTGMMRGSGLLPGEDREVALELSLDEARLGALRRIRLPGPSICAQCRGSGGACGRCGGRGVVRGGAEVEVKVPPQVRHGSKLRLRGLGGPGRPPGDAYVALHVRMPNGAQLVGRDIHAQLPLMPFEAERGASLELYGTRVQVPPGARDRQTLRVKGGGLAGGDMLVTLKVAFWPGVGRKVSDVARSVLARGA
jgi:DnaJ-class molecular chaperone